MVPRLVVPALIVLLTGPGFDGCQGGTSGGVVPPGTTIACFTDDDCVPAACEDIRCIASECVVVAGMRDGDLDGHAPAPCGDDCDDTDTRVFPGADETCDGRDQDCDRIVDEDAAPGAIATLLGTASLNLAAAAVGDTVVVTDTGLAPGVRLRAVDLGGHVGAAVPVTTDTIEVLDIATTQSGGVLVVGRETTTDRVLEAYPLEMSAGVLTVQPVMTIATLAPMDGATRVRVEPVDASFVVVWDDMHDARWAWMSAWAAPVQISTASSAAPLDVASVGGSLAIPSDATVMSFFSVGDGSAMGTRTFASGLAADPVAADASDYIVAFHDSFDHQLARMTATTLGVMHASPSQGSGLPLRIDQTPLGPLITRFDQTGARRMGMGVFAVVLPDTLDAVRVDFTPTVVSAGAAGTPVSYDVVSTTAGTAVLTNFGSGGAVLAVLACQPR